MLIGTAVLVVLVVAVNQWKKRKAVAVLREYSARFSQEGTPNATALSMQHVYFGVEKKPHGVLLIHGIPSSTSTFSGLCDRLEKEGIPHVAPMLTGFGNTELNLLPNVAYEDWLRDALNAYDTLAECAEKVSIVSTSTGSLVATWLSGQRQVEHLVLVVPNFSPGPSAARFKRILETPVASQALRGVMPYKFSDPEDYADQSRFRYPFHEVNSTRQMFLLQDEIGPEQIRVEAGIFLMFGADDSTVSTGELGALLEKKASEEGVLYEAFEYEAAHRLLQGAVAEEVRSQIVELLGRRPVAAR
ncbi:alpha/beta hydrolase [Haloferula helveola]|uniref:Alpha/beta hydrolase n=1 Tax=Haloferula helveola TaxID=490095 RepID=A0ABM7RFP9_9BACT|nr:alpha/beta hydrolase [Haloferula helveola]